LREASFGYNVTLWGTKTSAKLPAKLPNMDYPWGHTRRYNAYSNYFKKLFGTRVQKVSINAGFTCPNRDGTKGYGGCAYCNNDSFSPSYLQPEMSIADQIQKGLDFHATRYQKAEKHLAYFQAYSNTYDSLENLKKKYGQALENEQIIGLVIGTRSDCIDEEKLIYFADIAKTHYVIIEYGIESCYDKTLQYINRCHNFQSVKDAIVATHQMGIKTGAHLLFGLPGETKDEMQEEASILSALPLDTIKFHQLQITKGTRFEIEYRKKTESFQLFEPEEYADFIVDFVEKLSPSIVIERFASESPPSIKIAPHWENMRNHQFVNLVESKLAKRNTWQGRLFATKQDLP